MNVAAKKDEINLQNNGSHDRWSMDISLSRGRGMITESINIHALENLFNVFGNDVRNEKKSYFIYFMQ